jgi:hypothetical protein
MKRVAVMGGLGVFDGFDGLDGLDGLPAPSCLSEGR